MKSFSEIYKKSNIKSADAIEIENSSQDFQDRAYSLESKINKKFLYFIVSLHSQILFSTKYYNPTESLELNMPEDNLRNFPDDISKINNIKDIIEDEISCSNYEYPKIKKSFGLDLNQTITEFLNFGFNINMIKPTTGISAVLIKDILDVVNKHIPCDESSLFILKNKVIIIYFKL